MELFKEFCKRALRGELTIKFIMELLKELFAKVKSFYPPHRIIGIAISFALLVVGIIWHLNASYFERQIPDSLAAFGVIGIILFAVPAKVLLKGFVRRSKSAWSVTFGEKFRENYEKVKAAGIASVEQNGNKIDVYDGNRTRLWGFSSGARLVIQGYTSSIVTIISYQGNSSVGTIETYDVHGKMLSSSTYHGPK
ncbi:MAG: hypothetical protein LBH25_11105 [Fibromonadaceae bacterium]|jgi:hypothetical protein|nr:hypothetical protein [Fibromonadaceae bacterium]